MLQEGRISPALASAALERHGQRGERFEEALLECGLPESVLLRHLAEMFETKFISTKTLSTIKVPRATLTRLPRRLAERYAVVPVRFAADDALTIITSDPANPALIEQVRVAAGAREVKSLVARPAAISAAILRLYAGDARAFERVSSGGEARPSMPANGATRPSLEAPMDFQLDTSAFDGPAFDGPAFDRAGAHRPVAGNPAFDAPPASRAPLPPPATRGPSSARARADLGGNLPPGPPPPAAEAWLPQSELAPELDAGVTRARSGALGDPSKLAEAMMVMHERSRGSLKSHSVRVARLSYSLCRQMDLSEPQAGHAWATGLFHDLGKTHQHHLTPLNVWQLQDHETAARAQYTNPARLLKSADVPETVLAAILHMYERFDGKGFPDGLEEERIPFQSRVLALCDSVADLTLNPDNTLGRIVSPLEACNHLRALSPRVFDPTLLAHFSRLLVERKLDGAFLSDQSVHGIEKLLG
jgi:HD-GYP domain-containing protein (c-di-GMP phosphodiesterase class II)